MGKRVKHYWDKNFGSVSSGTMKEEDLIPAFLDALESQRPLQKEHKAFCRAIFGKIKAAADADHVFASYSTDSPPNLQAYWDSEEASYDLNEGLFEVLNEYAPPYFYFGAHPGDGADYGFWLSEEWEQSLKDNEGIKVDDLSKVPKDHFGEVAVVSDHGNVTLYVRHRNGHLRELWSIV